MSLVVTSAIVAVSIVAGRLVGRLVRRVRGDAGDEAAHDDEEAHEGEDGGTHAPRSPGAASSTAARGEGSLAKRTTAEDPFARFPCRLGDVILALGTDEAWLAGALLFVEEIPAAALFIAPDAGGDRAILARPRPNEDIVWLAPLDEKSLGLGAEPPSCLEHGGETFERVRRLPYHVERHGSGAPDVGDAVIFAEYTNPSGDVLVALFARGASRAFFGRTLTRAMYEVLASGHHEGG